MNYIEWTIDAILADFPKEQFRLKALLKQHSSIKWSSLENTFFIFCIQEELEDSELAIKSRDIRWIFRSYSQMRAIQ